MSEERFQEESGSARVYLVSPTTEVALRTHTSNLQSRQVWFAQDLITFRHVHDRQHPIAARIATNVLFDYLYSGIEA